MPIDFDLIRSENLEEYGKGTRHLKLLGDLYSDRTHFIYELLQNAEDAGAKTVEYHLYEDRLELHHDGRLFDEADVRGICGVGEGTKADDITKIGRFGVGFKSVYAFTDSPCVHSGDDHFKIEQYVRPFAIDPVETRRGWTLISLPFNKAEGPSPAESFEEIERGLDHLHDWSLLFLRSVRSIRYVDHKNDAELVQKRAVARDGEHERVTITTANWHRPEATEAWFVWSRDLESIGIPGRHVEIAVRVEREDGKRYEPVAVVDPPLVVFFPTEKETHLGFLLQGPFRTTPARDNVPSRDETNQAIVQEAAALLVDMLFECRDRDLLTDELLRSLPLNPDHFDEESLFHLLHGAVIEAFSQRDLVRTHDGRYVPASATVVGRGAAVRSLLTTDQLSSLLERSATWTDPDLPDEFEDFLRDVLEVGEVTPTQVVSAFDTTFLEAQPAEWICSLYEFLGEQSALSRRSHYSRAPVALMRPIARLADGRHVLPYGTDDEWARSYDPAVWLPTDQPSQLPTLHPDVVATQEAMAYLKSIGLREPDLLGEVLEVLLPAYRKKSFKNLDTDAHLADVRAVIKVLETTSVDGAAKVRNLLEEVPFVVGRPATGGKRRLCLATEVFVRTPETTLLLGDASDVWFVDEQTYGDLLDEIVVLGSRSSVEPTFRPASPSGVVSVASYHGWHARGYDRFDPEASCDDLLHALSHPTLERSRWIWNNIVVRYRFLIAGVLETSTRQDWSNAKRETVTSSFGEMLREHPWLPTHSGEFRRPKHLELEDLPPEFDRSSEAAELLEMQAGAIRQLSRELGISTEALELLEDEELLAEFLDFARQRRPQGLGGNELDDASDPCDADGDEVESLSFAAELRSTFDRRARTAAERASVQSPRSSGTVPNPEIRRERVSEELAADRAAERPSAQRFTAVPTKKWERKKFATRDALVALYGGECQVCSFTFLKASGQPYFEGIYLVSRTKADWIDRLGNVVGLCANCAAKFQHGTVNAPDFVEQVSRWRARAEGGEGTATVDLELVGESVQLRFAERHLLDLQVMLDSFEPDKASECE